MAFQLRVVPLENPSKPPRGGRKSATFKAGWANTMATLQRELEHLNAKDVILQGGFEWKDIRNDGYPRGSARPTTPEVVLTFTGKHGEMTFPCNTFDDWEDNVRAIALTLDMFRRVDRYGTTPHGEQYRGFRALPETIPDRADDPASVLVSYGGGNTLEVRNNREARRAAYVQAVKITHPDANGGDDSSFKKVQRAYETLEASAA